MVSFVLASVSTVCNSPHGVRQEFGKLCTAEDSPRQATVVPSGTAAETSLRKSVSTFLLFLYHLSQFRCCDRIHLLGVSHSSGPEKPRPCTTRHKASSQSLFLVHRAVITLCPYVLVGEGALIPCLRASLYGVITSQGPHLLRPPY